MGIKIPKDWKNLLILGDNKLIMSSLLKNFAGKINLIYIDPPFFTKKNYKVYKDTWSSMDSYLKYIHERLVLMKELLAENGSIYVHLDWHVAHYVKVMMDEIFGYENFRNEIVWSYRTGGASVRNWSQKHDTILFYSKTDKYTFNTQKEKAYTKSKSRKAGVIDYGGGETEFFEDEYGVYNWVIARDVWDIPYINSQAYERLAFDTQKPEALLKHIILASSNTGDIVADFFCGSGTTGAVAEKLGRRWIMSDLSKFAIHTTRKRLMDIHNSKDLLDEKKKGYGKPVKTFEIKGETDGLQKNKKEGN
ncbi:MAG: site-specific DNA-methyltransferase [Methanosarcinales archaeon]